MKSAEGKWMKFGQYNYTVSLVKEILITAADTIVVSSSDNSFDHETDTM